MRLQIKKKERNIEATQATDGFDERILNWKKFNNKKIIGFVIKYQSNVEKSRKMIHDFEFDEIYCEKIIK